MKQIENILSNELKKIHDSGLYKDERQIESTQSSIITVKGNEVINFVPIIILAYRVTLKLLNQLR